MTPYAAIEALHQTNWLISSPESARIISTRPKVNVSAQLSRKPHENKL